MTYGIGLDYRGGAIADLNFVDPLSKGRPLSTQVIEVPQRNSLADVALWRRSICTVFAAAQRVEFELLNRETVFGDAIAMTARILIREIILALLIIIIMTLDRGLKDLLDAGEPLRIALIVESAFSMLGGCKGIDHIVTIIVLMLMRDL